MILLASAVYQFFAAMVVLFAVLFIIGFLWNTRTMPPREFLGAGGVLIGLAVAAVIFLGIPRRQQGQGHAGAQTPRS